MPEQVETPLDHGEEVLFTPDPSTGETAKRPRGRKKRSIFEDRVVRTMGIASLALVALFLVTLVSALLLGVDGGKSRFRTAAEKDVAVAQANFETTPTEQTVLEYVAALIQVDRLGEAQKTVDRSIESVDQSENGSISAAQANLHLINKDYELALEAAAESRKIAEAHYDKLKAQGGTAGTAARFSETYWATILLQAKCHEEMGEWDKALPYYDEYLDKVPTNVDALVNRGNVKIELGDNEGAKADFESALTYTPGYQSALDGLDKIGAN